MDTDAGQADTKDQAAESEPPEPPETPEKGRWITRNSAGDLWLPY